MDDALSGAVNVSGKERAKRPRRKPAKPEDEGRRFLASVAQFARKGTDRSAHRKALRVLFQSLRKAAVNLNRSHEWWVHAAGPTDAHCRQELGRLLLSIAADQAKPKAKVLAELTRALLLVQLLDIASGYPTKPEKQQSRRERRSVAQQDFKVKLSPLSQQTAIQVNAAVHRDREFHRSLQACQSENTRANL